MRSWFILLTWSYKEIKEIRNYFQFLFFSIWQVKDYRGECNIFWKLWSKIINCCVNDFLKKSNTYIMASWLKGARFNNLTFYLLQNLWNALWIPMEGSTITWGIISLAYVIWFSTGLYVHICVVCMKFKKICLCNRHLYLKRLQQYLG